MLARGIRQWGEFYPTREVFAGDIGRGTLLIAEENGVPLGVVALDEKQSPEYQTVAWQIISGRVLVIHRLAVDPAKQGRGIARALMDFAEDFAAKKGYNAVRLDAYSGNPRALALYERRGYVRNYPIHEATPPVHAHDTGARRALHPEYRNESASPFNRARGHAGYYLFIEEQE